MGGEFAVGGVFFFVLYYFCFYAIVGKRSGYCRSSAGFLVTCGCVVGSSVDGKGGLVVSSSLIELGITIFFGRLGRGSRSRHSLVAQLCKVCRGISFYSGLAFLGSGDMGYSGGVLFFSPVVGSSVLYTRLFRCEDGLGGGGRGRCVHVTTFDADCVCLFIFSGIKGVGSVFEGRVVCSWSNGFIF